MACLPKGGRHRKPGRIVLVLCFFLIVERACHSSRAGGIGVLVYAANPEFYSLGAQYGYQTLALAFAVAVVYLLFVSIDAAQPKRGRLFALALISIAGMVVSHHVTAWLTVGFLVVWAAGLRFIIDPPGPPATAATAGQTPATEDLARSQAGTASSDKQFAWRKERRKRQSRIVGLAAIVGVVLTAVWIAFLGHVLTAYIDPLVQGGARSAAAIEAASERSAETPRKPGREDKNPRSPSSRPTGTAKRSVSTLCPLEPIGFVRKRRRSKGGGSEEGGTGGR